MKLIKARFCPDCGEVFEFDATYKSCPSCTNRSTVLLANLFKNNVILCEDIYFQNKIESGMVVLKK
jgi:hypothetical protein